MVAPYEYSSSSRRRDPPYLDPHERPHKYESYYDDKPNSYGVDHGRMSTGSQRANPYGSSNGRQRHTRIDKAYKYPSQSKPSSSVRSGSSRRSSTSRRSSSSKKKGEREHRSLSSSNARSQHRGETRQDNSPYRQTRSHEDSSRNGHSTSTRRSWFGFGKKSESRQSRDDRRSRKHSMDISSHEISDPSSHLVSIEEVSMLTDEPVEKYVQPGDDGGENEVSCFAEACLLCCAFPVSCFRSTCLSPKETIVGAFSGDIEETREEREYHSSQRKRHRKRLFRDRDYSPDWRE